MNVDLPLRVEVVNSVVRKLLDENFEENLTSLGISITLIIIFIGGLVFLYNKAYKNIY